ncbi:MAG: DUF4124 domain-containing protein [Burkholderiales bacterium]|nr:DUF4124 domain-containing protein [Burkholderiales bacterium]
MPSFRSLILVAALLPLAAQAATWQWRDANGQMVYSDQPPPPDVRPAQIIRSPAPPAARTETTTQTAANVPAGANAAAAASGPGSERAAGTAGAGGTATTAQRSAGETASAAGKAPDDRFQSWADRDMAFRKRMAEREQAERKQKEEQEQAAKLARACDDARGSLRTLESGMRIVTLDAKGEQAVMDDAERARRIDSVRRDVSRHCSAG